MCVGLPCFPCLSNRFNTRDVDKKGHPLARSLEKLRYNRLGQRALTLAFYIDAEGKLGIATYGCASQCLQCLTPHYNSYDFNDELGEHDVPTFEQKYPKDLALFMNKYFEYGNFVIGIENGETPEAGSIGKRKKKSMAAVLDHKDGYPIFKPSSEDDRLADKKATVRAFLNEHYGRYIMLYYEVTVEANSASHSALASGREKAPAPFNALDRKHLDWADGKYWPTDIIASDPSRMNTAEIDRLLNFWRQRQETVPASEIFRWSHVYIGPKRDRRRVPATYPNVKVVSVNQEDGRTKDSGKGKGKKAKGKTKGKQKAKVSAEAVDNSDQEDGRAAMGDLTAILEHTEAGPSLLTPLQLPHPEGQPSAVGVDFNIDSQLRPDQYSNWFSVPENGAVAEYTKLTDWPDALQQGGVSNSMPHDEYRLPCRPADVIMMQPVAPFPFWQPDADGQQDPMLQPFEFSPQDISTDAPYSRSFPTHPDAHWNTTHGSQQPLILQEYGRPPANTSMETVRANSTATDHRAADLPRDTAVDAQRTELLIPYDRPPDRISLPGHHDSPPTHTDTGAPTAPGGKWVSIGGYNFPRVDGPTDIPRNPLPLTSNDNSTLPPADRPRPKPRPFTGDRTDDIDAFFMKGSSGKRAATMSSVGPLPSAGTDTPALDTARRPQPKLQSLMGTQTDEGDASVMKNLNGKRAAPSSASHPSAPSVGLDTEHHAPPVIKKPRYDENIIQPKHTKRQPVPIQRPDYEPGPIAKMGHYRRA